MSRISIPIEALTSRINLGDRFSGLRSQSIASRFTNLKPIGEFLDVKRLSKPRDFGDVQARVNYNLAYFSSNYAVVFVMLSIYSLITNWLLLFDIIFVSGGMWVIGKLGGQDLEIGTFRATTSQLYTGLTNRECFFRGGGLGGRPRTPYGVPYWGRPPGARLGRSRDVSERYQSWEEDPRFEEVEETDDDGFNGVTLDKDLRQRNFSSDELRFDGIDVSRLRKRRSGRLREEHSSVSDEEDHGPSDHLRQSQTREPSDVYEDERNLVGRAWERIERARALGKTNVKLSQAEIDALTGPGSRRSGSTPVYTPKSKQSPSPAKAVLAAAEHRRLSQAERSQDGSPRPRARDGRARVHSTASDHSSRDGSLSGYPRPPLSDLYGYPPSQMGYGPDYYVPAYSVPRTASSRSLRQMQAPPPYQHVYPQPHHYVYPEDYEIRPASRVVRYPRPEAYDSEYVARSRSNSGLIAYPLDQLPNHSQTSRAPRFDPLDPRYGSPQRRVVSVPTTSIHHRPSRGDDVFTDNRSRRSTSSEDVTDDSNEGVQVKAVERRNESPAVRVTRSSAARSRHSSAKGSPTKGSDRRYLD